MKYGAVVRSVSGHDKGLTYVVIGKKDGFVLLCDGKNKLLSKPKKKNKKHLQCMGEVVCLNYNPLYDAHIRKELNGLTKKGG